MLDETLRLVADDLAPKWYALLAKAWRVVLETHVGWRCPDTPDQEHAPLGVGRIGK